MNAANLYEIDVTSMYEQIALSLIIGNGDAHLKNFAITYKSTDGPYELSPLYDVVCTKVYGDETTALSINRTRNYPSRHYLEKLGSDFGVKEPSSILDRIGEAVSATCNEHASEFAQLGAENIKNKITESRDSALARTAIVARTSRKRHHR